jgi:hypothetical protein
MRELELTAYISGNWGLIDVGFNLDESRNM